MRDWPCLANRAMPVLSMMMRMAELWGYRAHNSNPCRNTRRYRMKPVERFLTADEMARLNAVLTRDEFNCPQAVAVIRLLKLTGCRFGEIAALEWDWIKDKRIHLPDAKSGPHTVWLSSAARAVIDAIPRYGPDCPYLLPARPPTRPIDNIASQWHRIRDEAGLPGLRLHDLRDSWASTAAMNGVDMVTIAKLLRHALAETTERYVHLSDQSVADAADRVSNRIHAALAGREEGGGRCSARCVRPRPDTRPSRREPSAMSAFDLTKRLARESKSNGKDTILFDKALPDFGLRIHPSGRKVYIVQPRIEGRSRRIVVGRDGEMEVAEARRRARDMLASIRAGGNPAEDIPKTTSSGRRRPRRFERSRTSICAAANRIGSSPGAGRCASNSRLASCPRSAGCRTTVSAPRTWPRGSMRPARTGPARPTAPSRYYVR